MKKVLLFAATVVTCILLCLSTFAAEEPTVYVTPFGNDSAAGTADAPFASLYAAFRALPDGGTVVLQGAITMAATELPSTDGLVTITSKTATEDYRVSAGGSGIIYMGGNITLTSPIKFENIDILATKKNLVFVCNGHYACFGEGITVTVSGEDVTLPGIVAGRSGATPADGTYLEICSGNWNRVRAGSRGTSSAAQTGIACLVIRGGTFESTVDGGGDSATNGDVYMFIYGGTFKASVNIASAAEITGNVYMSIYGGDFVTNNIRIGRGGAIGGDATVNIFTDMTKKVTAGTSAVAGGITANIDGTKNAETDLVVNYVIPKEVEKLKTADDEFIKSAAETKLPKKDDGDASTISGRDMSDSGTIARASASSLTQNAADVSGDGKVTLKDIMLTVKATRASEYNENADINADGLVTFADLNGMLSAVLNNKATVERDSVVNVISEKLNAYGAAAAKYGKIEKGYVFGTANTSAYSLYSDVVLNDNGIVGLYFGGTSTDPAKADGYYFEVDSAKKTATLYSVSSGIYRVVGEKSIHMLSNNARIRVDYGIADKDAATLYFEDNSLVLESYPKFDLSLEKLGDAVGLYAENASASLPVCVAKETVKDDSKYFTNNLLEQFTDPEVFFENGKYYLYGTRSSTQNQGVQCFSTTDFKNFKDEGFVLKHGDAFGDGVYKAANIVKYGDYYYLFYMAKSSSLDTSVTAYASAKSPAGPFKNADKTALTGDSNFIGGQPFVDEDGTVYLIYARTTGGNKLYGSKITLKDGKATIDLSTEKLLLEPTEPWENAKASVVECGYLVKHEGTYYLLYSGGNYNSTYGTGYATASSPLGPYTKYEHNPILVSNDQAFGVGAATIFVSPDGSEHFIAYLRNFSPTVVRPLLTCIDRIRFADNPNGGLDIIEMYGPTVNPQLLPSGLGDNTIRDYQAARFHW